MNSLWFFLAWHRCTTASHIFIETTEQVERVRAPLAMNGVFSPLTFTTTALGLLLSLGIQMFSKLNGLQIGSSCSSATAEDENAATRMAMATFIVS